jgi:peroxiredoxin
LLRLQRDYRQFTDLDAEVVAIAPDTMENSQKFFTEHPIPFIALVDDSLQVFQQFDVQSKWISLGQRPGLFIIDKSGMVQFAYIGSQQWEIPTNEVVLSQIKQCCK